MKPQWIKALLLGPLFLAFVTINADAQNFVYVSSGNPLANSITAFSVGSNGALTPIPGSPFATGGSGLDGRPGSVCVTASVGGAFLFVGNASDDISVFSINPATGFLTPVPGSPFPRGGVPFPFGGVSVAVTPNNRFLFASEASSRDIAALSIAANGALTPVSGSPFVAGGRPLGVRVSPDGRFLAVALAFPADAVEMFSIGSNGALTPVPGSPFGSPAAPIMSARAEMNCASNLLFAPLAAPGTNIDVFSINPNGALTPLQTSSNPGVGIGSGEAVLSPNERFLFVSNPDSSSVTVFNVATNGTLLLVSGSPFGGTGAAPIGVATNAAGTFLFTANVADSTVSSFGIGSDGALSLVGNFPTGQPQNLVSLAAFPPTSCFDICVQDDINGCILKFNSNTGAYVFTNCRKGITLVGKGMVTTASCKIELFDNGPDPKRPDRSVSVRVNRCTSTGNASISIFSTGKNFMIGDSNIWNNTCACN